MKSKISAFLVTGLMAIIFVVPVLAGGWAVITLDNLPSGAVVGEPLKVSFAVRQHGRTLMGDLTPTVNTKNVESGDSFSEMATPVVGQLGHYEATLNFPSAGTWEWSIQAFTMNQPMPDLLVSTSQAVYTGLSEKDLRIPMLIGAAGLAIVLATLALSLRTKKKWVIALVLLGLMVGGAGFTAAASREEIPARVDSAEQKTSLIDTGQTLFVAKGCVTCHTNNRIEDKYYEFRSNIGPSLSRYTAAPEFLKMWLKDPASVRPKTEMPNLELGETEIEALIAFLSDHPSE